MAADLGRVRERRGAAHLDREHHELPAHVLLRRGAHDGLCLLPAPAPCPAALPPPPLFTRLPPTRGQIIWAPPAAQTMVVQLGDLLRRLLSAGEREFTRLG